MKKELMYGVCGLFIGGAIAGLVAVNVNDKKQSTTTGDGSMSMANMVGSLKGEAGDDFDKAFIAGMIEHHQGAIDMAKLAKNNAKHQEIKDMAEGIISAQSKEIDMMQTWQGDWGYKIVPVSHDSMDR